MKRYLILILFLCLEISISFCKTEEMREIKYRIINSFLSSKIKMRFNIKNHKMKLFQENLLNKNTIMEIDDDNYLQSHII